ncbi:MAG: Flp pilus assembly protein CpaB [Firmicutes bacterium]|nr:Flp pilus assembly protein CpaB [Alicyclobacillaceae bacterium]MCL6497838.1 Flp pilus assembly protein CpaB [Bacillota bacterium]
MRRRWSGGWVWEILAILAFFVAGWLTLRALALVPAATGVRPAPTVPVVVAKGAVAAFTPLAAPELAVRHFPPALVPAGAVADPATVVGRVSTVPLAPGQPVLAEDLLDPGQAPLPTVLLSAGERAVTVALGPAQDAGGWLRPGETVALYDVTAKGAAEITGAARVLSINGALTTTTATPPGQAALVTFAVPKATVAPVLEAAQAGALTVVLTPATGPVR